jgi:hypothetical protein
MHTTYAATREQYLYEVTELVFRPWFAEVGHKLPQRLRIGVGWSSKGRRSNVVAECWSAAASADGTVEVIIGTNYSDTVRVLDALLHELCHAVLGTEHGHDRVFAELVHSLGLIGPATATVAGPELTDLFGIVIRRLGEYPHAELGRAYAAPRRPGAKGLPPGQIPSSGPKQTTRLIKAECVTEGCDLEGYTIRLTRKWIEAGTPLCPSCHNPFRAEV